MLTEILSLIASLAIIVYVWQRRNYSYWQRMGVKHIKPSPIFGNVRNVLTAKVPFFGQLCEFYNAPGFEKEPLIGLYMLHRPGLLLRDLELIKTVMIKKFNYFTNRALQTDPHHDPLGYNNLFFVRSEWKELRQKLSPVFTSGKTKQMYPLMVEIGKNFEKNLKNIPTNSVFNVKDTCARFTTDLIATIAFGLKANALGDINSEFFKYNKSIFEVTYIRSINYTIMFLLPMMASLARVKFFSKEVSSFIRHSVKYVLAERERSGVCRNDLIDILLAMRREAEAHPEDTKNKALEFDYLVAQAAVFQTAGYETSSSTMSLTLFELANNYEIQDRLREEITDFFGDNDHIDYERIQEMPYLTQVVNETLRKYPIVGNVERECAQPASGERFTLAPYHDMEVPSGMPIYVSTLGIHRDEQYWPEPEKFDPERFAPENRHNLNMDAYMPFGIGPRNCIGMRLGLLQTKLGLVHLLRQHRVVRCEKTVKSIEMSPFNVVITSKDDVVLKLQKV